MHPKKGVLKNFMYAWFPIEIHYRYICKKILFSFSKSDNLKEEKYTSQLHAGTVLVRHEKRVNVFLFYQYLYRIGDESKSSYLHGVSSLLCPFPY